MEIFGDTETDHEETARNSMKIFASILAGNPTQDAEFSPVEISEDWSLEEILEAAGKVLEVEVTEALESTYLSISADVLMTIPGSRCFLVKDEKNKELTSGTCQLLLIPDNKNPQLILKVGKEFMYSLNAKQPKYQKEENSTEGPQLLPVVIHQRRHLVVPGKLEGEFYGIVLPKDTPETVLDAVKEILETRSLLNINKMYDIKADVTHDAKTRVIAGLQGQAIEFMSRAQKFGGDIKDSKMVQKVLKVGTDVGTKAVVLAKGVHTEIKQTVESIKDDIEKTHTQEDGQTYTSAVAKVLTNRAARVAVDAQQKAILVKEAVTTKIKTVVDEARDKDGKVSPQDLAIKIGEKSYTVAKKGVSVASEMTSHGVAKATEITSQGVVLVKDSIADLKLVERLAHAQKTSQEGLKSLSTTVGSLLVSAKASGTAKSAKLVEKIKDLSDQIALIERAQKLGTWTSETMSESIVAVKKATSEVQKLVTDKHAAGRDKRNTGEKVEAMLEKGADLTVKGIEASTEVLAMGIKIGKMVIKKQIGERNEVKIHPRVKTALLRAQQFSAGAAVVSEALAQELVGNAGQIADRLATTMAVAANAARSTGSPSTGTSKLKVLSKIQGPIGEAAKQTERVVGKAAEKWAQIVVTMRDAGISLVKELGDATSEIAEHRFGTEVGHAVSGSVEAYTNVSKAMTTVSNLTDIKGIAKKQAQKALKTAGKVLSEAKTNSVEGPQGAAGVDDHKLLD
ncbi:hypothetical protein AAMO2058_001122200 [Amorphochlora amoebiformis]